VADPLPLPRPARSILLALTASLVAIVAGLAPATHAAANPNAQQVQAQIDQLWSQLEPLIEKYDGLQDQLKQNQAKQAALSQQLAPLQMEVDLSMSRVGALAAQLYERGPGSRAAELLNAGSPEDFLDEISTLDQLARRQQSTISATQSQLVEYNKEKAPLDLLVAQEQQQAAEMDQQKKNILAQLNQLQQLRQQAYGSAGAPSGNLKPVACPAAAASGAAAVAVAYVCSKIGSPYQFGATGPAMFDCSGLVLAAWGSAGVSLYHYTVTQQQETTPVSAINLRPGDLVFYGHPAYHVAMYIGNGYVVHAPKAGDWVREAPMSSPGAISGYGRVKA
jgi:cell wall-associated NlpC family hydrolase